MARGSRAVARACSRILWLVRDYESRVNAPMGWPRPPGQDHLKPNYAARGVAASPRAVKVLGAERQREATWGGWLDRRLP